MFDIINTLTEKDIKENFVAIGSYINEQGVAYHSVLVVKYQNELKHIHFTGKEILFDTVDDQTCFHKITETINEELIPAFIVMCNRVLKTANPRYGFFYSGEYYDLNGVHFSDREISETMTCSGFCLNILKGFLEEDYLRFSEWNTPSYPTGNYLKHFANRFGLDINKISESHRRISPLELLCSGFFQKLPITKNEVDSKVDETSEYLKNYFPKTINPQSMNLYAFQCSTKKTRIGLTPQKNGNNLPTNKCERGNWGYFKTVEVISGNIPLLGAAPSDKILAGIEKDGYFINDTVINFSESQE